MGESLSPSYQINTKSVTFFMWSEGGQNRETPPPLNFFPSSNGLEIKLDASAWFQPDYENLGKLHQEKGENYVDRVLLPTIRSAARSVVGRYTPEQLYSSKRDAIQNEIFELT